MTIQIETERLILRNIKSDDIKSLLDIYNKEINMRYIADGKYNWTENEIVEKYSEINESYKHGFGMLAVELKESNIIIGEAGLFKYFDDLILEIGYIIDSTFWKNGFGKEICLGLINYAFNILNVKSVVARMYANNKSSVILSEKCKMKRIDSGYLISHEKYLVYEITSQVDNLTQNLSLL